jgi:hypothetical protein
VARAVVGVEVQLAEGELDVGVGAVARIFLRELGVAAAGREAVGRARDVERRGAPPPPPWSVWAKITAEGETPAFATTPNAPAPKVAEPVAFLTVVEVNRKWPRVAEAVTLTRAT